MKVGNLISLSRKCKLQGRLGLVLETSYGAPNCARIFWLDTGDLGMTMYSNVDLISEAG